MQGLAVAGVGAEDQHRNRAERREHQAEGDDEVGVVDRVTPEQQAAGAQEQGEAPGQGESSRQGRIRRRLTAAIRVLRRHISKDRRPQARLA